jgi:putative peptidoglycan lipid II flippase
VFIGGVVQLGFQLPFLRRLGLLPMPVPKFRDEGVRRVLGLMGPAIFGVSVAQINLLINTLIASFLVTGSVSWLYYSDRLVEFPLGVLGTALGTVILPQLSDRHMQGSSESFSQMLDWGLRWTVMIGTPASLGLGILAGPLLCTLFQYGEFSGHDVEMSSRSLMAYSFGLLAFILIKVLAPGYYARQDIRTPVRIAVIAMASNLAMNLVLVFPLAHAGLALATSLSAYLNAGLLFWGLRAEGVYQASDGWRGFLLRVAIANGLMAVVLFAGAGDLAEWLSWTASERIWRLTALVAGGGIVYFAALWLFGLRWRQLSGQAAVSSHRLDRVTKS